MLVALCAGCLLWISNLVVQREARADVDALNGRHYPPLMNGRVVDFTRFTVAEGPPRSGELPGACHLVVFLDDTCAACRHAVPRWTSFLNALPSLTATDLDVITIRTATIAHQLIEAGAGHFAHSLVRLVVDDIAFPLATGLSATPAAVVLNRDRRLRHVNDGLLGSAADVERLTQALRQCDSIERR